MFCIWPKCGAHLIMDEDPVIFQNQNRCKETRTLQQSYGPDRFLSWAAKMIVPVLAGFYSARLFSRVARQPDIDWRQVSLWVRNHTCEILPLLIAELNGLY
jgi:hypothetical protein